MLPWPAKLAERYPFRPISNHPTVLDPSPHLEYPRHPTRPWWRQVPDLNIVSNLHVPQRGWNPSPPVPGFCRVDFAPIPSVRYDATIVQGHGGKGGHVSIPYAEIDAKLADYDMKYPLPHPGFRVGQVWATGDDDFSGYSLVTLLEDYDSGKEGSDISHPPGRWFSMVMTGGERISDKSATRQVHHLREDRLAQILSRSFLVADAVCPWLAPWSPS